MTHRHLTEEELIVATSTAAVPPETDGCEVCRTRHQHFTQTLDEVADTATLAADAAFPPERLARQRARILARIERYGQRARVLAFPASHQQRPSMRRRRPFRRWVAAAAAAGLIVGLAAGRTVRDIPSLHVAAFDRTSMTAHVLPLRASSETADDELLREIEKAVGSAGPNALQRIEDVTPDAWDAQ